ERRAFHFVASQVGARLSYIEGNVPNFRRDKLVEFPAAFDGSLTGYGIDWWYTNVFGADKLGRFRNFFSSGELERFVIIDKVQVTNADDPGKGGREIDRLEPTTLRHNRFLLTQFRHVNCLKNRLTGSAE